MCMITVFYALFRGLYDQQKIINSQSSILADMLTYEKLIASGSLDTSTMVKKADALVRTYSN
jgi:hypothetical protein